MTPFPPATPTPPARWPLVARWGCALAWAAALAFGLAASQAGAWPQITLPPGVQQQDLGPPTVHNGVPMKALGFTSPRKPAEITAWFENTLGAPLSREALGKRLVLSKWIDGFFVNIQIEALHPGTRALIGVSDLQQASQGRADYQAKTQALQDKLPLGAALLAHNVSHDGAQTATAITYSHDGAMPSNAAHLKDWLRQEGLTLERVQPAGSGDARLRGTVMYFRGQNQEATASLSSAPDGKTNVFLVIVRKGQISQ